MAWDAPASVTTGDLITAATWNQDVVDNVQYLHDNRWLNISLFNGTNSAQDYVQSYGSSSWRDDVMYGYWPGTHLDLADVSVYYWGVFAPGGSAETAESRIYDITNSAAITGTISVAGSVATTPRDPDALAVSSDIAANMPSGDALVQPQYQNTTGGNAVLIGSFGILVTA